MNEKTAIFTVYESIILSSNDLLDQLMYIFFRKCHETIDIL